MEYKGTQACFVKERTLFLNKNREKITYLNFNDIINNDGGNKGTELLRHYGTKEYEEKSRVDFSLPKTKLPISRGSGSKSQRGLDVNEEQMFVEFPLMASIQEGARGWFISKPLSGSMPIVEPRPTTKLPLSRGSGSKSPRGLDVNEERNDEVIRGVNEYGSPRAKALAMTINPSPVLRTSSPSRGEDIHVPVILTSFQDLQRMRFRNKFAMTINPAPCPLDHLVTLSLDHCNERRCA